MATEVKKKRGRPPKRLAAEKEAEKSEKEAAAKRAVDRQLQMDLELLRLTNKENPFRYTVNKRKDSWSLIAVDVTALFEGEIFDDCRCSKHANAEKEKEGQNKQLTQAIQNDALITMRARVEPDVETVSGNESSSSVPKKSSPKKPAAPFRKRKVEPVDEYLEGKKIQQLKELDMKMEMHRDTMLDNAAERSIRREFLEFDREKLRMEDADKA
ncbi:hypothetical protein RvY_16108 [Ramazzottius varieornatus]|uniref:No apical meristem-associated C-terminal domain-containing protein n=1 Tax=Ramazzottius varieornatus TaxID=947166 RepID=A0A1D1VXA0_RAMVA|nr:hypothetical protein RvY_16108 [Ramazzottius varieornatus]